MTPRKGQRGNLETVGITQQFSCQGFFRFPYDSVMELTIGWNPFANLEWDLSPKSSIRCAFSYILLIMNLSFMRDLKFSQR
jgi:hypothetical protein